MYPLLGRIYQPTGADADIMSIGTAPAWSAPNMGICVSWFVIER
jgi:hypothetical protein